MKKMIALSMILVTLPALAQESPSYKLTEHVLNAGGHPDSGTVMTSAGFRISLDAMGEGIVGNNLSGPSFRMDGGFGTAYPPPGEVSGLSFSDKQILNWNPERSVGVYNLYRDLMSNLSGLGYGECHEQDMVVATVTDADEPPGNDGYFYLVTAENRLGEESVKGSDSGGATRVNASPCP